MTTIKCIAIDDEPLALGQVSNYIKKVPFLELVKACQDPFEAITVLSDEKIDLIFVDINMPDLNGLDFVRSLTRKPLVVFTTAYSEYAIDGFRVDAIDYLLKPFEYHDLLKAAEKALMILEHNNPETQTNTEEDDFLFVKADYKTMRINIRDIKYIEGMSEYVRIHIEGEEKAIMSLLSMKKLEERLPSGIFLRVHKSYIVNLQKVKEIARMRIIFDKDTYIPVGDSYKEALLNYIEKKIL